MKKTTREYEWASLETREFLHGSKRTRKRVKAPNHYSPTGCQIDGCDNLLASPVTTEELVSASFIRMCEEHYILTLHTMAQLFEPGSLIRHISGASEAQRLRWNRENEEAKRRESERRSQLPGWIYYLKVGDLLKIGYATILYDRLRQYPPNITVLAVHPGTRDLETHLHRKFRLHRERGREWYTDAQVIREHISEVNDTFGPAEEQHPWLAEAPSRIAS